MDHDSYWKEKDRLNAKLKELYPRMFRFIGHEARMPIRLGLECGSGWYPILTDLFKDMSKYPVVIHQVKEKFGGLRVYWQEDGPMSEKDHQAVHDLVAKAEDRCWRTCENCGAEGQLVVANGWRYTHCDLCKDTDGWKERDALLEKLRAEGKLLTPYELMFGKDDDYIRKG